MQFVNIEKKFDQRCFYVVYCILSCDLTTNICDVYR